MWIYCYCTFCQKYQVHKSVHFIKLNCHAFKEASSPVPNFSVLFLFWKHVATTCYYSVQQNHNKFKVSNTLKFIFKLNSLFKCHTWKFFEETTPYIFFHSWLPVWVHNNGTIVQKRISSLERILNIGTLMKYLQFPITANILNKADDGTYFKLGLKYNDISEIEQNSNDQKDTQHCK